MVVSIDTDARKVALQEILIDLKAAQDKITLKIGNGHDYYALDKERENLRLLATALESVIETWRE